MSGTLHWGLIPASTASGLKSRNLFEGKQLAFDWEEGVPLQGRERLRLAPGQEISLSLRGRVDGLRPHSDPKHRRYSTNAASGARTTRSIRER